MLGLLRGREYNGMEIIMSSICGRKCCAVLFFVSSSYNRDYNRKKLVTCSNIIILINSNYNSRPNNNFNSNNNLNKTLE